MEGLIYLYYFLLNSLQGLMFTQIIIPCIFYQELYFLNFYIQVTFLMPIPIQINFLENILNFMHYLLYHSMIYFIIKVFKLKIIEFGTNLIF